MAFTSILRKSANSLAPLAIRLTRVQRHYHSSCIFTALNHGFQSQQPAVNRFYQGTLHFSTAVASRKSLLMSLLSEFLSLRFSVLRRVMNMFRLKDLQLDSLSRSKIFLDVKPLH